MLGAAVCVLWVQGGRSGEVTGDCHFEAPPEGYPHLVHGGIAEEPTPRPRIWGGALNPLEFALCVTLVLPSPLGHPP